MKFTPNNAGKSFTCILVNSSVDAFLKALGIEEHRHKVSKSLSGGTKRKLSFAIAMISSPAVAFLDEPSSGYALAPPMVDKVSQETNGSSTPC